MSPARRGTACALLVAAVLLPVTPASAHTTVTGTSVDAGVLPADSREVVLRLDGQARAALSTVVVTGADGRDRGAGPVQERDGALVRRLDAALPPGGWTLSYRVVAADGHPLTGSLPFRVPAASGADSAAPATPPAAEHVPARDDAGPPLAVAAGTLAAGGLALGALLLGARLLSARRRPGPRS